MNIIILGGFLGAGKTTFLLQLAKFLVNHKDSRNNKVAIIENEIGSIGVDNQLIGGNELTVETIFAGCVCCSLASELISGIKKIEEQEKPDWLIIEATGVADPSGIKRRILNELEKKAFALTLIDSKRWFKLIKAIENIAISQLEAANCILLNKVDMLDKEELTKVEKNILSITNNNTSLIKISAKDEIPKEFFDDLFSRMKEVI